MYYLTDKGKAMIDPLDTIESLNKNRKNIISSKPVRVMYYLTDKGNEI